MYIYIYIFVYSFVYLSVYVFVYMCIYIHICIGLVIHLYIYVCVYIRHTKLGVIVMARDYSPHFDTLTLRARSGWTHENLDPFFQPRTLNRLDKDIREFPKVRGPALGPR